MLAPDISSLWDIPIGKWEAIFGAIGVIVGIVGQLRGWIANRKLHRFLDEHFGLVKNHLTLIEKFERSEGERLSLIEELQRSALAAINGDPPPESPEDPPSGQLPEGEPSPPIPT
jgi:hypothetical protein